MLLDWAGPSKRGTYLGRSLHSRNPICEFLR